MALAPQVGCGVKELLAADERRFTRIRKYQVGFAGVLLSVLGIAPLHATTFYLTVAGLGGEPDYDTRFHIGLTDQEKSDLVAFLKAL